MQWLNDLIWVGNTLYPRWFIFAAIALSVAVWIGIAVLWWRFSEPR